MAEVLGTVGGSPFQLEARALNSQIGEERSTALFRPSQKASRIRFVQTQDSMEQKGVILNGLPFSPFKARSGSQSNRPEDQEIVLYCKVKR